MLLDPSTGHVSAVAAKATMWLLAYTGATGKSFKIELEENTSRFAGGTKDELEFFPVPGCWPEDAPPEKVRTETLSPELYLERSASMQALARESTSWPSLAFADWVFPGSSRVW